MGFHLWRCICQQANIVWRKIVAHSGLGPATFGFQGLRAPYWATSGDMWSGIFNFYCNVLYIATMLHLTAEPRGGPVAPSVYHIIFYENRKYCRWWNWENYMFTCTSRRSNIIFIYNYCACMTQWRVVLWVTIALYSINKNVNPTLHISRRSSVGSALGLKSKGCWFEPTVRNYFSSSKVRLFSCASLQVKTNNQNEWRVTNQIEYTGLRQDSYL